MIHNSEFIIAVSAEPTDLGNCCGVHMVGDGVPDVPLRRSAPGNGMSVGASRGNVLPGPLSVRVRTIDRDVR